MLWVFCYICGRRLIPGGSAMNDTMTLHQQRADALEQQMSDELDYIVIKSRLYSLAEADMSPAPNAGALMAKNPKARVLMGDDPRLPAMPEKPTLVDFFRYRFGPATHVLQSARHAVNAGLPERWCSPPPVARHLDNGLDPRRPRLLGRAAGRALCRRGGDLGDPRPSGAALLSRRIGRLRVSRVIRQDVRRRLPAGRLCRAETTSGCATTNGTCRVA